jgi:hypothetical protein
MNRMLFVLLLGVQGAAHAQATPPPTKNSAASASSNQDPHRSEDIARHRQMARAHEEAARCLEAGTPDKQCHERLREACRGIGVGQYCGMRHAH